MKNNKGFSMIALIIMIIVTIILAWIVISNSTETIDNSQKAVFQDDFKNAYFAVQAYNTEAVLRANNPNYAEWDLTWDGKSERAQNTAQIQNAGEEDTIKYILKDTLTKSLDGKVEIYQGQLCVKEGFSLEEEWVEELSPAYARPEPIVWVR